MRTRSSRKQQHTSPHEEYSPRRACSPRCMSSTLSCSICNARMDADLLAYRPSSSALFNLSYICSSLEVKNKVTDVIVLRRWSALVQLEQRRISLNFEERLTENTRHSFRVFNVSVDTCTDNSVPAEMNTWPVIVYWQQLTTPTSAPKNRSITMWRRRWFIADISRCIRLVSGHHPRPPKIHCMEKLEHILWYWLDSHCRRHCRPEKVVFR